MAKKAAASQKKALAGKVAIVTGAARGIGKAAALAMAKEGATVVIVARSTTPGHLPGTIYTTADEVRALGAKALPVKCDITSLEEIEKMVRLAMKEFGRIDVLLNNANVLYTGYEVAKLPVELLDNVLNTNIRGTWLCTRTVLPHMIKQKSGSVISLTSMSAVRQRPTSHNLAYAVSKAAIERFTVGLAQEVKGYNIAVNAIEPTMLMTEEVIARAKPGQDWTGFSPPEAIGPPMVFLAQQNGAGFTGQIVSRISYLRSWP